MNTKTNLSHSRYSTLAVAITTILATSCVGNARTVPLSESPNAIRLAQTQPEELKARAKLEAFGSAQYTYCDAKVLASYWGQGIRDSKIRAGGKLLQAQRQGLEEALKQARKGAKQQQQKTQQPACRYDTEGGYTYDDAELLARYWGKPSAWEAKLKIEQLLLDGQNASIQKALQQARQASNQVPPGKPTEDAAFNAYANSGYTYCDAKLLATHWGMGQIWEGKVRIGEKLLQKKQAVVVNALTQARSQAKKQQQQTQQPACRYDTEGGYTYDDAELLAHYWGKPSAWEAKLKIEQLLLDGQDASIQTALQRARQAFNQVPPGKPTEDAAFNAYANSGYTYCDAKLLATHWGVGQIWESKVRIGEKLLQKKQAVVVNALTQARSQAKKQQQQTQQPACRYDTEGGYTYDDAELLARYWGKPSAWEAKLKIQQLLLDGQDASIQTALQQAKKAATTN